MSRLSYGGGMFSPVRCDTSLNEVIAGRESEVYFDFKRRRDGEKHIKNKEKDFSNEPENLRKKTLESDLPSALQSHESLSGSTSSKDLSAETDLTKNKLSFVTTRNRNLNRGWALSPTGERTKAQNDRKSKNSRKDSLSNYITVRSENSASKEIQHSKEIQQSEEIQPSKEIQHSKLRKSSSYSSKPPLASLAEEQFEKESVSPAVFNSSKTSLKHNILTECASGQHEMLKNETQAKPYKQSNQVFTFSENTIEKIDSNTCDKELPCKVNGIKNEKSVPTIDCETQTDLLMAQLNFDIRKAANEKCAFCEHLTPMASISNSQSTNQSQQIQANIIEKLVRNTVSMEFDGIRQMLYLNQLSLLKNIHKNSEAERQNSANYDTLIKVIEELMEENRKLKDLVAAYHNI